MIKVKVPSKITVLAIDCTVDISNKAKEWLHENHFYGYSFRDDDRGRVIMIDNSLEEKDFSCTFIHEVGEFIRGSILVGKIDHLKLSVFGFALHQIMEQLQIRFVKGETC